MLAKFITQHRLNDDFANTVKKWFIPLAEQLLVRYQAAQKTFYVGLNGCQGSGKSTLADFIQYYLGITHELNVVVLSLDDFYFTRQKRTELAMKVHPLLQTRGVPGTHDMVMAKQLLHDLAKVETEVAIPRFNKATDNPLPSMDWPVVKTPVDMVIFEGWCWGVMAQSASELERSINSLEAEQDEKNLWRNYVNQQLKNSYEPLYTMMDYWVMLQAPNFECVFQWRLEQEKKLATSADFDFTAQSDHVSLQSDSVSPQSHIMTPQQIRAFIQHYQRLTDHALETLPVRCNRVFKLDEKRQITAFN